MNTSVANPVRQWVYDIQVKHWISTIIDNGNGNGFSTPIPLSKDAILPVYRDIQKLGQRLLDEDMGGPGDAKDDSQLASGFITHMKEFAKLFWYEV